MMNAFEATLWMQSSGRMLVDAKWPEIYYRWQPHLKQIQYRDSSSPVDRWEECPDSVFYQATFVVPE